MLPPHSACGLKVEIVLAFRMRRGGFGELVSTFVHMPGMCVVNRGSFVAIFGNLSKFSMREIVSVVGGRSGSIVIEAGSAGSMRLRLNVNGDQVQQFMLERAVHSPDEIRLLLKRMVTGNGSFQFEEGDVPAHGLALRWDDLLEKLDASQGTGADDLPHPQTRFSMLRGRTATFEPELENFLRASRSLLETGSCAEEISQKLNLDIGLVLRHLHRLRELRKIWPVRAYTSQSASSEQKQENTDIAKRLMGHLNE